MLSFIRGKNPQTIKINLALIPSTMIAAAWFSMQSKDICTCNHYQNDGQKQASIHHTRKSVTIRVKSWLQ